MRFFGYRKRGPFDSHPGYPGMALIALLILAVMWYMGWIY